MSTDIADVDRFASEMRSSQEIADFQAEYVQICTEECAAVLRSIQRFPERGWWHHHHSRERTHHVFQCISDAGIMDGRIETCLLVGIPLAVAAVLMIFAFTDTSVDSDSGLFIGALVCMVFMAMGDAFIIGYGGGSLAGWSTYTEEEKSEFDERKMLQASGLMMSVCGIILFVGFMGRNWFSNALFVFIGLMLAWCVAMLIFINTSEMFLSDKGKEKKISKRNDRQ